MLISYLIPILIGFETFSPSGGLMLVGGGSLPAEARERFIELAGGQQANIVVIPTASGTVEERDAEEWLEPWRAWEVRSLKSFHTRDRELAGSEEFCKVLQEATGIWISGGDQSKLSDAYLGTKAQEIIESLPLRGGVVGGTSAGAAIASHRMIAGGRTAPEMATGFNLLPQAIVDQHFTQRDRIGRLRLAVAEYPECVGIGIDEGTAVLFHHRSMAVIGPGKAHILLAQTPYFPARELAVTANTPADWTTLVRMNEERRLPEYPVSEGTCSVSFPSGGALVIAGGGRLPQSIIQRFVDLAGGENAKIVVLPTATEPPESKPTIIQSFTQAGAGTVDVLPQTSRLELNALSYLEALRAATGIWFGGGRQWRLVDHYAGSPALDEFRACLDRGGVIGGSSAGASIQGELLIRGAPSGNDVMVQDGYRRGFAFLKGVGIDQHFSQRGRQEDLRLTIKRFPSVVGIGIDEATALVVDATTAEVLGDGAVHMMRALDTTTNSENPAIIEVLHSEYPAGTKLSADNLLRSSN
jgi:cyanophycinase